MKNTLLILVSIIMIASCSNSEVVKTDETAEVPTVPKTTDKYDKQISMQCSDGSQVSLAGGYITIDDGDGFPYREKVGSDAVYNDGSDEIYLVDILEVFEYYIDFDDKYMVVELKGIGEEEYECY